MLQRQGKRTGLIGFHLTQGPSLVFCIRLLCVDMFKAGAQVQSDVHPIFDGEGQFPVPVLQEEDASSQCFCLPAGKSAQTLKRIR